MAADNDRYPRVLDRAGCIFGQQAVQRVERLEERMEGLEAKIDRLTWALAGAAITFATGAVMLALNLWMG